MVEEAMEATMQQTKNEIKEYRVFIGTPYLTKGINDFKCPGEMLEQTIFCSYDANNLKGVRFLQTSKKNIVRISSEEDFGRDLTLTEVANHDLAIAGSTESIEKNIRLLKGSGLIVARYSIFYGKTSRYTGNSPESSGYSLDLSKAVGCAVTLMASDDFLEAIVSREEERIRNAIAELNKGKEDRPILITPYLTEALKISKN